MGLVETIDQAPIPGPIRKIGEAWIHAQRHWSAPRTLTYFAIIVSIVITAFSLIVYTRISQLFNSELSRAALHSQVTFLFFGAIVGSLVLFSIILAIFSYDLITALEDLADFAESVSRGEYMAELRHPRDDEFARMADAVSELGGIMQSRIDEVEDLNDELTEAVETKGDVIRDVAEGDLTRRMPVDYDRDQLNHLAEDFNEMLDTLQSSIEEAKMFSQEVERTSEVLTNGIEEIDSDSHAVSETTQTIRSGAETQNEELQDAKAKLEDMAQTQESVATSTVQLSKQADRARQLSQTGRQDAETASEVLSDIEQETTEAVEAIQDLNEEMREIEEVVEFISGVAQQTNMLAINAGIEAANGAEGSSGDGFSVVAEEVKELADDVSDAADDIEESLAHLQEKTQATAADIQATKQTVEAGSNTIEDALDALDEIGEAVEETAEGVQEINSATEAQSDTVSEVVTRVDTVAEISERTVEQSTSAEETAESQSQNVTRVGQSVHELLDSSATLNDLLGDFEVDVERTGESVQ